MDVEDLQGSHVWIVLKEDDRKEKKDPTRKVIEGLKKKGIKRVKVSPKIPFILSLTAGFLVQVVLGNLVAVVFLMFA